MSGESKPMSIAVERATDLLKPELQREPQPGGLTLGGAVVWMQRALLTFLAIGHGVLPFFFARDPSGDLLRDCAFVAQVSVLLVLLTLGGLRWWMILLVLAAYAVPAAGWYFTYPPYLVEYAGKWLLPYTVCCAATLVAIRCWGFRGTWRVEESSPRPLQVSILSLLIAMTVVGAMLTATNFLRGLGDAGLSQDAKLWIIVATDGVMASMLTVLAVWSVGRRGSPFLRMVVLLLGLLFLGGCQIFAFQMESFWHLPALTTLGWSFIAVGTLLIWRVCGWHVVLPKRDLIALNAAR